MNRSNIGSTVGGGVQNLGITASAVSGINRAFQINEFYKQKVNGCWQGQSKALSITISSILTG